MSPLALIDGDVLERRHELGRSVLLSDLLPLLLLLLSLHMLQVDGLGLLLLPKER